MGEATKIEWATHTFNPWRGCTKVAEGCKNCYADTLSKRNPSVLGIWGPNGTRVRAADAHWRLPVKWNREAEKAGERHRVFCASLADVFEDWQGPIHGGGRDDGVLAIDDDRSRLLTMDDLRRDLFALIDATPNLDWLLLTKRPENVRRMWPIDGSELTYAQLNADDREEGGFYRPNVWLLTSIATQEDAERNIPELLKCRDLVPVLGVSAEPLLGPIDLAAAVVERRLGDPQPNWVIVGGESGSGSRPCNLAWLRSLIAQCKTARVPCFVKQLGAKPVATSSLVTPNLSGGPSVNSVQIKLRDKKGGDWDEWAMDLRVREFPRVERTRSQP